jgi:CDP-diacylglycerol pyrophosphatase
VECSENDPDCIWQIVQACKKRPLCNCAKVDSAVGYAVLKAKHKFPHRHYLTIPLDKISGIDDQKVINAAFPNFWRQAWEAAPIYVWPDQSWIGLAINSAADRSQDQLHIHMACVAGDVRAAVHKMHNSTVLDWTPVTLKGHSYMLQWIDKHVMETANLFHIMWNGAQPKDQAMAIFGSTNGVYLLKGFGHAEGLLDPGCKDAAASRAAPPVRP